MVGGDIERTVSRNYPHYLNTLAEIGGITELYFGMALLVYVFYS